MARPSMRALRRLAPLWLVAPVVLLLYWWTWTESAAVTLDVAGGRCTAVLYGRSSAIDCPGLAGGRLAVRLLPGAEEAGGRRARPEPPGEWTDVGLVAAGATALATDPLPAAFEVTAVLRRPIQPAGLLLLRPDGGNGWVFIVDAANRRGAWWTWAGEPATPLRGIPLDRPLAEQAKPFLRQLLAGYLAAAALVAVTSLFSALVRRRPRLLRPTTNDQQPTTRPASEDADSATATRHSPPATRRAWPLVALLLLPFAIALHVAVDVLERTPHIQDSVTYLFQAQTLARGALTAPAPPLAAAEATAHFDQEFLLVRDGRWFGKYPPGWPALLALGVLFDAPWLINPLLATLTAALVYQLGRCFNQQGSRGAGAQGRATPATDLLTTDLLNTAPLNTVYCLLPPLLLTTSPFFLIMSGSLMAHPAELLWAVLFMVAWSRALAGGLPTHPTRRWAVVAGLALGALFLTRQFTALTIGLSFGGGLLLIRSGGRFAPQGGGRAGEPGGRGAGEMARGAPATRHAPSAPPNTDLLSTDLLTTVLLPALLALAPFVLALPLYQAAVTGDARADPRLLYWPYDRVGFGPGIGEPENAFTLTPTDAGPAITWYTDPEQPPRGHSPARGLYNLGRNLDALQVSLFGWPLALALAFVWLAFLLRRPSAGDWLLLLVVLAVAGGYVAYWAAGIAYGPRYFYAALPALVILTARGATALAAHAHSRGASEDAPSAGETWSPQPQMRAGGGQWAVAVILLLLVGYNLAHLPDRLDNYHGYNFVSAEGQRAVEAAVTPPALVFVTAGDADWWEYGAFFSGNTPWLDGPVVYARDRGPAENARLRAAFPERHAYHWTDNRLWVMEEE